MNYTQPSLLLQSSGDQVTTVDKDGNPITQIDTATSLANIQSQAAYTQENLKNYGTVLKVLETAPKDC